MNRTSLISIILVLVGVSVPARAMAQLDLTSLQELQSYAFCEEDCSYGSRAAYNACLSNCGPTDSRWDVDTDGDIDQDDYRRALREYWGEPDCTGADAGTAPCLDVDGDSLYAWQEAALGTSDNRAETACADGEVCGFAAACTKANPTVQDAIPLDVGYCAPRPGCSNPQSATCTAFHLELVEATDQEVVVHLHFDHAPVPARILDLHVQYPKQALRLVNARALEPLIRAGKQVEVRSTGYETAIIKELRLVVIGTNATRPIPNGAIAELVFSRTSQTQSGTISFVTDNSIQRRSMAPDPNTGTGASPLEADFMWGTPIQVDAVGANTPRLALYYSFDDNDLSPNPRNVPDETTACGLIYGCDADTRVKYNAMQAGVVETDAQIEGVSGPGVFLDGFSDHLELPVVFDDTNLNDDDYSFSFWFYHEGDRRGTGPTEQVLFAHNTDTNSNGYGVVLKPANEGTFSLEWFDGDRNTTQTSRTSLGSGLPDRTWLYLAASIDGDGTGCRT